MYNYIFSFFILLIPSISTFAQTYFEGTVSYKHFIDVKDTNAVNKGELMLFYGTNSKLYFKEGNYKWDFEVSSLQTQIYHQKENKIYDQYYKNDTIYYMSAADTSEQVLAVAPIKKGKADILGNSCDLLLVKSTFTNSGEKRGRMFFFSEEYPVKPEWMAAYTLNNQNIIYSKAKAIPLQIIVVHRNYRVIYEAVSVLPEPIPDETFHIDKDKPLQKLK